MSVRLYIPTYRRVHRQYTWNSLPERWREQARLVAPPDETAQLEKLGYPVLPCPVEGIGAKRQWIIDQHTDGDHVLMLDDDLRFYGRRADNWGKFVTLTDAGPLLDDVLQMLEQVPLVGLAARSGANYVELPVRMFGRIYSALFLNVEVARRHDIRFDQVQFMEDFDVALRFLLLGYPTALNSAYAVAQATKANATGGCSVYRDAAGQAAAARTLHARYPDLVKVVEKQQDGVNGWGTRTDVRIAWTKAFKAGQEGREVLGLPQHPKPKWDALEAAWLI